VVVPDIGGWRVKRMPRVPLGHRFEIVPAWICEVLSPLTEKHWTLLQIHKDETVIAPPFSEISIRLSELWVEI